MMEFALQCPPRGGLGFRFDHHWQAVKPAVGEIMRAMLPVTLGLSITQINTVLDRLIALAFTQPADGSEGWLQATGWSYPLLPGAGSTLSYGAGIYQFPL